MSAPVSRRTVAKGAAWAVPVVAVGAAAPALAASVCATINTVSGTHRNGNAFAVVTVTFSGSPDATCITSLNATGGSNGGVEMSYGGSACGATSVTFNATTSDNGNNVKGSYTGTITYTSGSASCQATVNFTVTAP